MMHFIAFLRAPGLAWSGLGQHLRCDPPVGLPDTDRFPGYSEHCPGATQFIDRQLWKSGFLNSHLALILTSFCGLFPKPARGTPIKTMTKSADREFTKSLRMLQVGNRNCLAVPSEPAAEHFDKYSCTRRQR